MLLAQQFAFIHKIREPGLGNTGEFAGLTAPGKPDGNGVERVVLKNQPGPLRFGQALFHQGEIQIFIAAVKLVADDRMTEMREMDAKLVLATGKRLEPDQSERRGRREGGGRLRQFADETAFDPKFRLRGRSVRTDAVLDGDDA